ncbi:MAG: SRPBCC family protein [Elainellaceae cyanobacterium]
MEESIPGKQPSPNGTSKEISDVERWASLIGGGVLALSGLRERSLRGALLALAGGGLAYHGATGDKSLPDRVTEAAGLDNSIRVEKSVTIFGKSPQEIYTFWRNFQNLPSFMKHLQRIDIISDTRSHWVTQAPLNSTVEWDAEIVADRPNELIAWTSVDNVDIDNSGFVRFQPAPMNQGTEVKVVLEYSLPGGTVSAAIAKLFGEEPEQLLGYELRRLQMLMEAGEIATNEGQPRCGGVS